VSFAAGTGAQFSSNHQQGLQFNAVKLSVTYQRQDFISVSGNLAEGLFSADYQAQ